VSRILFVQNGDYSRTGTAGMFCECGGWDGTQYIVRTINGTSGGVWAGGTFQFKFSGGPG
jgi:hypothetical protein